MKNKFLTIYIVMLGVLLASCLDDDKAVLDPSGVANVIEFLDPSVPASPAGSIYPAYSSSYLLSPQDGFELTISYSGPEDNNGRDIELTLAVDPAALDRYNAHMEDGLYGNAPLGGTVYDLMPTENYSIPNLNVTIPSGQTKVAVPIIVYPNKFDFSKNFAVPLRIVSTSSGTLSAHYSVAILSIGARNPYDGIYSIEEGSITRFQAPPDPSPDPVLSGEFKDGLTLNLVTKASDKVGIAPVWKDGSSVGGIDNTAITINPIANPDGSNEIAFTSSNATLKKIPGAVNKYDPATREFTINITWGSGATVRNIEDLKIKWTKARP